MQLQIREHPLELVPPVLQYSFEQSVLMSYWDLAINGEYYLPVFHLMPELMLDDCFKIASFLDYEDPFEYEQFSREEQENWKELAEAVYGQAFVQDIMLTVVNFQLSIYTELQGHGNLPIREVW